MSVGTVQMALGVPAIPCKSPFRLSRLPPVQPPDPREGDVLGRV